MRDRGESGPFVKLGKILEDGILHSEHLVAFSFQI